MKILVTGATGFIGNHVINYLLKEADVKVIATSRSEDKAKNYSWFSQVGYIQYDLHSDEEIDLFGYFEKPDVVIHLAWDGLPDYKNLIHLEKNLTSNYKFIKNLISNGLANLTVSGTCFEYGMIDGCLSEELQTNPSNPYALGKDSLRKFLEELHKHFDFNYKWVRLFYMYGKGQNERSLPALLDKAINNGDKEFNMSGGEQLRDYLPVEEVAKSLISIAIQNKVNNQIVNCCSGKPISVRKFVENYLKDKEYKMKLNLGFYPYASYEPMAFWGCDKKLKSIISD